MADHVKAWQCIGCGNIEAPQTCIGVCEHHKVQFVYAFEHDRVLAELERYGLIAGRPMGRDTLYDEEALVVARLAAGFMRFGVEARHLRMYKVSAEREASFFEQVVLPLVKQRNPDARRQAVENLGELASLGESLRAAMLRQALKGYTG
jgi:hypothetical protein